MPTATPFNNLITFSRGSNATVTGSNGLIQYAPNNLLLQSESFDNSYWAKLASTITANSAVAPDGTTSADKLAEDATTASHYVTRASADFVAGTTYTLSFYAKAVERQWVAVGFQNESNKLAWFDLATGVVGTVQANISGTSITPVGNGWYRCSITAVAATTNPYPSAAVANANGATSYAGSAGSGVLIWGAQLELGSTATTYNPTTVKNLLGFSEAFDNAAWTKVAASIVTGAQANPVNGLFNAQKFMEDTTNAEHIVRVNIALSTITGTPYGYSVYAKAAGRTQIRVTDNNVVGATFTLTGTGATSNISGGVTASISPSADGWYRCFISVAAASVNGRLALNLVSSGNTTYTGDGNSGVYIYGAQLSDSASLDPYVPTPGAAPSSTAFYGPRFDFDPVTRAPRGLLVEEQRTNLILRSEELDNAGSWTATDATVSANTAASPSGAMTADKLSETATTARHFLSTVAAVIPSAATYNVSVYAKAVERSRFNIIASGGTPDWAWFDLSAVTATVGSGTGAATITAVGSGWYRCTFTITATAAGAVQFNLMDNVVLPARLPSYAGTAGSGLLLWGTQAEAGAFATSYIPTVASTVTRSADVATISGSLFSQWYRQDEGVIAADTSTFKPTAVSGSLIIAEANDNTLNNRNMLFYTGADVRGRTAVAGVTQAEIVQAYVGNATDKLAYAYRVNDFAFARNGGLVGTDTTGTVPVVDRFMIGGFGANASLNGHIRNIRFIPARAADFQLQGLST
ncbi:hypothetical protein UFOVP749_11 [uncultured Caudovirales phage]|uniref:Uncharacterized protein n=1 Tax=uncultured Caudovirales phage TaxID=2100421 RepID=A0A6J7X3F8_9CAUD|nr:hypothetical protein UFOVP749_11 [uncultured Caudovirales phage]